jgi:alcohol dehydrogenase class IV
VTRHQFEFATATRIVFGTGKARELGPIARQAGRRALVVTGRNRTRAEGLLAQLQEQKITTIPVSIFGEPEVSMIEEAMRLARSENCDVVISQGGGSAIDAGKAMAAMLANEGELLDYLEVIGRGKTLTKPSVPFLAIPTTAGTGAEVTRNAVLASAEHRVKVSLRSAYMLPNVAIVDPELTYGLPPALTASTGLDALTQVIEPYVCTRSNPMTDSLCVEGIRRAARSLATAYRDGGNIAAREDLAIASLFGGLALANAGLGAVHGFAGPIGGMVNAPHGAVCAALLPHVMQVNLRALNRRDPHNLALNRYSQVARLVTSQPQASAEDGVEWIRQLVAQLQIPGLSVYGLTARHTPELVQKAAKASSMKPNPIQLTREELTEIIEQAL